VQEPHEEFTILFREILTCQSRAAKNQVGLALVSFVSHPHFLLQHISYNYQHMDCENTPKGLSQGGEAIGDHWCPSGHHMPPCGLHEPSLIPSKK